MKLLINLLLFELVATLSFCKSAKPMESTPKDWNDQFHAHKWKGISFVSTNAIATLENFSNAKENSNCSWVSLMPFGFCEPKIKTIQFNHLWQWKGERSDGIAMYIDSAHASNLKVMLKPQIWFPNSFSGDYKCRTTSDWENFEESYWQFLKEFSIVAEKKKVELLCIGTEWKTFIKERPMFWKQMIDSVKNYYTGPLTYAANWDNYQEIPFWEHLDYIGVDAYFPLTESAQPTEKELNDRFKNLAIELAEFSKNARDQQIIFTEYGWRSCAGMLNKPWLSGSCENIDLSIQATIYKSFYYTIWNSNWLKGGFIW